MQESTLQKAISGLLALFTLLLFGMLAGMDMQYKAQSAPVTHCGPASVNAVQVIEIPNAAAITRPLIQEG